MFELIISNKNLVCGAIIREDFNYVHYAKFTFIKA